ncbi:MAG: DUF1972 domain-containing protein [Clostridiaceae bacterium]
MEKRCVGKEGGFETFVDKLAENKKSNEIKYYVSCLSDNNAHCFNVKMKNVGGVTAVFYDITALNRCIRIVEARQVENVCTP